MSVTAFQSDILKLLAQHRRDLGESYVAGGVALNILLNAPRRSRDIDLFHETASLFNLLPAEQAGTCVLTDSGTLFNGSLQNLAAELAKNKVVFHKGHIRGAWPIIQ